MGTRRRSSGERHGNEDGDDGSQPTKSVHEPLFPRGNRLHRPQPPAARGSTQRPGAPGAALSVQVIAEAFCYTHRLCHACMSLLDTTTSPKEAAECHATPSTCPGSSAIATARPASSHSRPETYIRPCPSTAAERPRRRRPRRVGEYAQSCLGRERILEYGSERYGRR